jgi:hypothetical protein
MAVVKASPESERGGMPDEKMLAEMTAFNEELTKAGVILAMEGLHPSSKGKRVRYAGGKRTVIDGPFAETKELIAGYWVWKVKSMDEALDWAKRAPFQEGDLELRPVFELDEFGAELTPELRKQEERQREKADELARNAWR